MGEPIVPVPGESLRGIVSDTCFENGLPNSFGLLGPLGLLHRNKVRVSEGDDIDPADLAYAMNLPLEEVTSRRYEALELGYIDFFGLQINKMRMVNSVRRFAPAALRLSPHHRAVWELRDIPFCLETWDKIIDTCPCPTEGSPTIQRWTRTGSRASECDRCGHLLSDLPSQFVPKALCSDLAVLSRLVMPQAERSDLYEVLPKDIGNTDRGRIFDCLRLMSEIAKGGKIAGLSDTFADAILRWHRACKALLDWPNAFPGDWIDADVPATAYAYRRDVYLDLCNDPEMPLVEFKKKTGSRGPLVRNKTSRPLKSVDKGAGIRRKSGATGHQLHGAGKANQKIGLRPASEAAKLDPETMLRARSEGMLVKYERRHGSRTLPAFDRQEATEFGERWNARIPISKVAYDFAISHHGVEQLVAMGVLEATGPRFEDEGPHFTDEDVDGLVRKLIGRSAEQPGEWISLHDIMRHIDDRPKPWGPVIGVMLETGLPFRLPTKSGKSLSAIEVHRSAMAMLCDLRFDPANHPDINFSATMVQRDVCELFNLHEVRSGKLHFLTSTGSIPKRYDCEYVQNERRLLISHTELARQLSTNWKDVRARLRSAGVEPMVGEYYDRTNALTSLNATKRH